MGKVRVGGSWAAHDQLDGVTLEDGEKVTVLFPDDSLEYMKVEVDSSIMEESDMGQTTLELPVSKAFVTIDYKGLFIRVRLVNESLVVERR